MGGVEVSVPAGQARRAVPAVDQRDYPEPESGCGPAAMLNWFLWWQQQGLLHTPIKGTDLRLQARYNFNAIETEIFGLRGSDRARLRQGTKIQEIITAMDRLAFAWSDGTIRMHYQIFKKPLKVAELLEFTQGQRGGILITRVVKENGDLGAYHAVSLIAGDRKGYLMINNWGERVYGLLRNEPDGQYFYPKNTQHPALWIDQAVSFIPFHPNEKIPPAELENGSFKRRASMPHKPVKPDRRSLAPPELSTIKTFQVTFIESLEGGYIYRIRNAKAAAQAVFLNTFQTEIGPHRKRRHPSDIQTAERVRRGNRSNFGANADLIIPPHSHRDLWFEFDYLESPSSGEPSLIEVH